MDHATRASTSFASSTRVVDVLVPVALDRNYSYRVPRGIELAPGDVGSRQKETNVMAAR
jgi:primosomal protein N' (replication factor Y)